MDPSINEPAIAPDTPDVHRYERFIRSLCDRTGLSAEEARAATVAVLCTLRRHVSGGEWLKAVGDFADPIRPAIETCGRHPNANAEKFGRDEFLRRVGEHLQRPAGELEGIVRAVFHEAIEQLSPTHAAGIEGQLPNDLREMWQAEEASPGITRH